MAPADSTPDGSTLPPVTLLQPARILFGEGCTANFIECLVATGHRDLLVLTSTAVREACADFLAALRAAGITPTIHDAVNSEPTIALFNQCLAAARGHAFDGVIGLGGGSAMDVAKLVAALAGGSQPLADVFGTDLLRGRPLFLACLPTTSGTGSEVSPNALLLDESSRSKKAVISPHLVPDVACVDPLLTRSAPPSITAATGIDALAHCIEAYANRHAHPAVDLYALEGVRLIARHLPAAIANGANREARSCIALGSLYGGLCLGPVNTAAVHALAYPLAGEFHVPHGVSIAVLLAHVLRFNLPAAPERYAILARALGAEPAGTAVGAAERGVEKITSLLDQCPIPRRIRDLGVPRAALPRLAQSALAVTRLLRNNLRAVTQEDAIGIYSAAY